MALETRKPTAKPSWPALLIAGAEKSGKSYACAVASASPKIGRTLWVSVGETDPDEYGAIPGADFEIVQHDGTLNGIAQVLAEIASLPVEDKPTLLVVDSMTRMWDMITDYLTAEAKKRTKGDRESTITMDLWNRGKTLWQKHIVAAILAHQGPTLLTARLEPVTVMDERGRPTPIKADKIKTEKNLPYDVDGVIEMPERGEVWLSGVRSVKFNLMERTRIPDFTVDMLWSKLGLEDTAPRTVTAVASPDAEVVEDGQQA